MRRLSLIFLLAFANSSPLFAACNTVSALNCYSGPATWNRWNTVNDLIYDSSCTLVNQCTCGEADPGSPCESCGYQSKRSSDSCFTDTSCSAVCTAVPETNALSRFVIFGILACLFFVAGRRVAFR